MPTATNVGERVQAHPRAARLPHKDTHAQTRTTYCAAVGSGRCGAIVMNVRAHTLDGTEFWLSLPADDVCLAGLVRAVVEATGESDVGWVILCGTAVIAREGDECGGDDPRPIPALSKEDLTLIKTGLRFVRVREIKHKLSIKGVLRWMEEEPRVRTRPPYREVFMNDGAMYLPASPVLLEDLGPADDSHIQRRLRLFTSGRNQSDVHTSLRLGDVQDEDGNIVRDLESSTNDRALSRTQSRAACT